MKHAPRRFVVVTLTESEYEALRSVVEDPNAWLKKQVDGVLAQAGLSRVHAIEGTEPVVPAWSFSGE